MSEGNIPGRKIDDAVKLMKRFICEEIRQGCFQVFMIVQGNDQAIHDLVPPLETFRNEDRLDSAFTDINAKGVIRHQ